VCEPDSSGKCGWVIPQCLPGGAIDGGAGCPTPHPEGCNSITECPCADGTTQVGGCPNGFTCPEACCGHGGSK
jgi:hypothetical protein